MRWRVAVRWKTCLSVLLFLAACLSVFEAWLAPENIASWLLLQSFCS